MAALPTLPALAAQLATLQTQVDALQTWADQISVRFDALDESDEASGWAKWRDNQKTADES